MNLLDIHKTEASDWENGMNCPYCNNPARWCDNKEVYGKRYGKSYMCYWCKECDAYVGCHNNTKKPLGTMANKELRKWRVTTHHHIDKLWKNGEMTRDRLYQRLAEVFGYEVHVGTADVQQCKDIMNVTFTLLKQP